MLNKRVKTLLTLVLAGAMVLSEPAASWAAADKAAEEASQSETKKSDTQDSEKEEKSESGKTDQKEDKAKKKKKVSGNSASSDKVSASQASFSRVMSKAKAAPEDEEEKEDKTEDKVEDKNEEDAVLPAEDVQSDDVTDDEGTMKEETSSESNARFSETKPFTIEGGDEGTDYVYDSETGILTVMTDKTLTIGGTVTETEASCLSVNGNASLSLNGLHMTTSANAAINVGGSGNVKISLVGNTLNVLNGANNSIFVNSGGIVTLEGTGVLSGNTINGPVIVKGGNIQAPISNARSVSGNEALSPNKIGGLSANTLYSVNMNLVSAMEGSYENGVYSDQQGNVTLYLPAGYRARLEGNTLVVSAEPSPSVSPSPSPSVSPSTTPTPSPSGENPDIASEDDNGLYWIDAGKTYRSGATLQFYATGAGNGPEEPQELSPVEGSIRYVPVDWDVSTKSSSVSSNGGSAKGSWKKPSEETTGRTESGKYVPGEYRYKGSFVLNTTGVSAVPFTLQVNYQKQTYNADDGVWRADGSVSKSVNFFIRNTTATVSPRPSTTTYARSTVTTSALRNNVSSNARNARTGDETPIGTLVLLLAAAAVSGAAIFRKKRMSR